MTHKILNYYAAKRIRNPDNASSRTAVHSSRYVKDRVEQFGRGWRSP